MAKFKSNASRKRFLALRNKRKYAVGGLTPATNMYGDNTIPYTSSTVYEESNPEYQAQLAEELTAVQEDTSYQDDANAELNRQNKIEGYGMRAANMGLNKITNNVVEKGLEQGIEMPNSGDAKSMFAAGKDAFKTQQAVNQGIKSTTKAIENATNSTQLLDGLNKVGTMGTKANAVGSGVKAFASSAGPAVVGQLVKGVGDRMMKKNDDGDASTVDKGAGVSSWGTGVGVGVTAGTLGTMAGIGAANIWNPLGWATLAATGIGAGISYLSKRRKARKAGDAMDVAEMSRDADANSIERQQRFEGLKNKQYSGFDYGGDNKGPGFYNRGGLRKGYRQGGIKYQTVGLLGSDDAPAEEIQYDKFGSPIGQNLAMGNVAAAESTRTTTPVLPNTPAYMQASTSDEQNDFMLSRGMVYDAAIGGYVKPAANTALNTTSGSTMPADEMARFEQQMSDDAPTAEEDAAYAEGQARAESPMNTEAGRRDIVLNSNKKMRENPLYYAPGAIYGGALAYGTGAAAYGARAGYNFLKAPIQKYGMGMINNAKNAYTGLNASGQTLSTGARVTSGLKSAIAASSLHQLPDKAYGIGTGLLQESRGEGDLESRLRVGANLTSFLPGFKQLHATIGKGGSGPTVKDSIKIIKDAERGRIGNAIARTGLSFLKGDQNKWLDRINPEALDLTSSGVQLGHKQGIFKGLLNYGDNTPNSMFGTPSTEMREGGVKNLPGGQAIDIGNGATKYVGQTHEEGGIMADPQSEIENNEIEKDVTLADGSKNPYIFSEYLNTDGSKGYNDGKESIASVAEGLVASGAPQPAFDKLAIEQELKANRDGTKIMNTTMAKNGGFYQGKGIKKYQDEGLKPTLAGLQSQTNSNVTSMLQTPTVNSSIMPFRNTSLNRNQLNLSGNSSSQNYGLDYMRTLSGGGRLGGNLNYTPDNISAGLKGSFGNNNNNTWSAGVNKTLVDPTSTMPTSNNGMNFNLGANFKWRDGGLKYQTRGLVMSEERQEQYDNLIQFIPGTGYVGPDGTNYGFNEADVVDFVNSGGLDSYNANQGNNYMPSAESMAQYGLENDQQMFRDALRNTRTPDAPTNETTADPNFRRGQQGDLVVPADTTPTSLNYMDQDFNALNALAKNQKQLEAQALEVQIKAKQAEGIAREDAERAVASEAASNTSRSTQSSTLVNDYSPLSSRVPYERYDDGDATSVDLRPVEADSMDFLNAQSGAETEEELQAKIAEIKADQDLFVTDKEKEEYDKLSAKEKVKLKLEQLRGKSGNGSLLKAAQFIPAALAYMDKPDYMKQPNKVGGVPRVNLENVSLDDRQAVINSDNAAVQRMISNSGMGTAGFAARMAGWQKKEGLSAAVTAEQQRLNTQINNTEAQMNAEVEARNRMIQSQNRDAEMTVDRFNTESEAATKSQGVKAIETATSGLLTQFMDKQRIDADDRRTAAIAGQSGVIDREGPTNETNRHFAGTDITNQDQEWMDYYDGVVSATKKKFGGMRKIPRYGYSTK